MTMTTSELQSPDAQPPLVRPQISKPSRRAAVRDLGLANDLFNMLESDRLSAVGTSPRAMARPIAAAARAQACGSTKHERLRAANIATCRAPNRPPEDASTGRGRRGLGAAAALAPRSQHLPDDCVGRRQPMAAAALKPGPTTCRPSLGPPHRACVHEAMANVLLLCSYSACVSCLLTMHACLGRAAVDLSWCATTRYWYWQRAKQWAVGRAILWR